LPVSGRKHLKPTEGFWYTYDDNPAGGTSLALPGPDRPFEMSPGGYLGSGMSAKLSGHVTNDYEFGFIGMGHYFSVKRTSFDLSLGKVLRFYHKGDGKTYRVKCVSTHPDFKAADSDNQFGIDFTTENTWQKLEIPLAYLSQQPGWGSNVNVTTAMTMIKEIQFMTLGWPLESVELWIDGLEIY
jgi:hypothetical protein